MFHDPALVKSVVTAQKLTRLIAYELNTKGQIDRFTGDPGDVCDRVDYLVGVVPGPFRVECGTENDAVAKGGKTTETRSVLVWNLQGKNGAVPQPPPVPAAVPAVASEVPKGWVSPTEHALALQLEQVRLELKRQTMCAHDVLYSQPCRACEDEDQNEDEDEAPEQPIAGMSVSDTREIATLVRDLMREFKGGGVPASSGAIAGVVDDTMTAEDLALHRALKRMRAAHPDTVAGYVKEVLDQWGDNAAAAKPTTDEPPK